MRAGCFDSKAVASWIVWGAIAAMALPATAESGDGIIEAGEDETAELARAAQNPVASLISLPFQNNTTFEFGPREKTLNVLNIQPVWPFELNEDWNLITRTIVPVVRSPACSGARTGRRASATRSSPPSCRPPTRAS